MTSFPLSGGEVERPEVVRPCDKTGGSRSEIFSEVGDRFSRDYASKYHGQEVLPVTPESSPSSTPDLMAGFPSFPESTTVGTLAPRFPAFTPHFPLVSGYGSYVGSGFITPEMSPLDGPQTLSPTNLFPVLPSSCVPWPNMLSFRHRAPSYVDALTQHRAAVPSTGSYVWHLPETGSRNYDAVCTGDDILEISLHVSQRTNPNIPLSSGIPEVRSRSRNCSDVTAEPDCGSFRHLLPVGAPATGCRLRGHFQLDFGDTLSSFRRLPDCSQLDSDLSVADVEPAELDQYLDRKWISPCFNNDETSFTTTHSWAVSSDPPPTSSPDMVDRLASADTGNRLFDVDFSNSRSGRLSGITSVEGRSNSLDVAVSSATRFVKVPPGSRYSDRSGSGTVDDVGSEDWNASTSSLERWLSEDEVCFDSVQATHSVSPADDELYDGYPVNIEDLSPFHISD